mgnify:CR=1 FL=1
MTVAKKKADKLIKVSAELRDAKARIAELESYAGQASEQIKILSARLNEQNRTVKAYESTVQLALLKAV